MRKSGTLQFKGSPRVGHNLATQQQQLTGVLGTDLFLCKMVSDSWSVATFSKCKLLLLSLLSLAYMLVAFSNDLLRTILPFG